MEDEMRDFLRGYEEHADALFRYCLYKTSDREHAMDLVQETFMKTWHYMEQGGKVVNLKAFLYKALNNLIIDGYRKRKTVSLDALEDGGFDPVDERSVSEEDVIDGKRAIELLQRLPTEYRDAVFMRYVGGLDLSEIAEITGETENAISVRIHRGIKKLKALYDK